MVRIDEDEVLPPIVDQFNLSVVQCLTVNTTAESFLIPDRQRMAYRECVLIGRAALGSGT